MMDGVKKKITYDPALLYFSNKTDEDKPNPVAVSNRETYNNTNRKHGCRICGKRFFTVSSLNSHTEHHKSRELKSPNSVGDRPQSLRKGTEFACGKLNCNFLALDAVELQKHILCDGLRLTKDNASAFCERCESHFTSTAHLHAHTALTHSEGCPDISLNECRVKQIINDPLCLYVSENTVGENSTKNPAMYPGPERPSIPKKKMRASEVDDPANTSDKKMSEADSGEEKRSAMSDNHEKITNGVHDVRIENSDCGEFYSTKGSDSSENNSENSETSGFNGDLLEENVNIEIIVVQPSTEESSTEHSSTSDDTSLSIDNPKDSSSIVETVEALSESDRNTTDDSESKETVTNYEENLEEVRSEDGNVNSPPTLKNQDKKMVESSTPELDANESTKESGKNSKTEVAKNTGKTGESDGYRRTTPALSSTTLAMMKKSRIPPPKVTAYRGVSGENARLLMKKSRTLSPKLTFANSNKNAEGDSPQPVENSRTPQNVPENPKKASPTKIVDNHRENLERKESRPSEILKTADKPAEKIGNPAREDSKKDQNSPSKKESRNDAKPIVTKNPSINHSKNPSGLEKPSSTDNDRAVSVPTTIPTKEKPASPSTSAGEGRKPTAEHIVPKAQSEDSTPTASERSVRKRRQKHPHSDLFVSSNLTERSVRSRKKKMLPDFEYALDNKFDRDDSADRPTVSTSKSRSSLQKSATEYESPNSGEKIVRKRGRPRKSLDISRTVVSPSTPVTVPSSGVSAKTETATSTSKPTAVVTEQTPIVAKPTVVTIKPSPIVAKLPEVLTKLIPINREPSTIITKPSTIVAKLPEVLTKQIPINREPSTIVSKPSPIVAKLPEVLTKLIPINREPPTIITKPSPIVAKIPAVLTKLTPINTKPSTIVSKSSPIVAKPTVIVFEKKTSTGTDLPKLTSAIAEKAKPPLTSTPLVKKVSVPDTPAEESKPVDEPARPVASTSKTEVVAKAFPEPPVAKSSTDICDETEVFALTTTVTEADHDISLNSRDEDDASRSDIDDSWLKKLDFSEGRSVTDSWTNEPPKKKLGRPPKRRNLAKLAARSPILTTEQESPSPLKVQKTSVESPPLQQGEKKKRGRPRKVSIIPAPNVSRPSTSAKEDAPTRVDPPSKLEIDKNRVENEKVVKAQETSDTAQSESEKMKHLDAILDSVATKKKRGRPSKQKTSVPSTTSEPTSSTPVVVSKENGVISDKKSEEASSSITSMAVATDKVSTSAVDKVAENVPVENKNDGIETREKVRKKRGRPKKSVTVEKSNDPEPSSAVESAVEDAPEEGEPKEATAEDINMKKKREFMEYIRIKADKDDSDQKPGKKVDSASTSISPPKKRGRPRLDEVAKKRAAAAELAKNDRPYSIYNKYSAASDLKRRRDPLQTLDLLKIKKNKRRKLLDDAKRSANTSASEAANDSSAFLSDSSTADDGATLHDDDLPYVVKKSGPKRIKKQHKVKPKKSRDTTPPADDVKEDETKNIDPELYAADMRNRAKYSRVFRKVKEVPKHDEYFPNSLVTCGRCKKLMTLQHYHLYHQVSHYFLCWLDGEKELDFKVDTDLIRIMQQYVNPDALRKKLIKLHCEQCHKIMKSVVGYVSHIRFCSKMNEEEFLGTCVLCNKKLKPSSLRHHYVKTHNIALPNVNAKTKDELFLPSAEPSTKNDSAGTQHSSSSKKAQKHFLNFERKPIDKSDIISDEKFWTTIKTSYDLYMCMGLSCKHMTLSKDDLKNHILNCNTAFCEFTCATCQFVTRYESEIIYHTKNSCKDFSDSEDKADEEVEKSVSEGRRVSNRVKKRKYHYDDEFFDDNDGKRAKGDDDFHLSNEDDDNDEAESLDEDSDHESEAQVRPKSRSTKRRSVVQPAVGGDSSLRIAFLNHDSTRQYDPLNWTIETRQKICSASPILEELKVNLAEWGLTSATNVPEHVPKQKKSMKVASDNKTFVDYNLFQAEVSKGVPISYTGGPVWALAWAPLPAHVSEQYLAVAGLQHMNHLIDLCSSVNFPSLIQIWKYGALDNISNTIDKPILDVAIAHKYGAVSCMEWCPSGGFDNRPGTSRLGILAVATSAGCVIVYSVPKFDTEDEPTNRICCAEPDLILKVTCDNVQCTRVVWLRKKDEGVICGGFSNGTIALWNIGTKSSLLRDGNKIFPYRTFEAHNASILALDAHWLDNGRYLLTSSIDRVMKYWDLEDLSGPLNEQEGSSPIVNVVWLQQWAVSAIGVDSSNLIDASAVLSHSRDTTEKKKSISCLRDTCWSVAYSDWNDMVALSLCSGQVSVFAAKHMSTLTFKQPDFEKVVTETSLVPLKDDDDKDAEESESTEELIGLPETKSSYDCTSVVQEFGLQFCDRMKNKAPSTKSGFTPDRCNVMSINKVSWNQNYNSFNWLAVGYECGFVRVFRVERFDKLHLTKFYKTNENSNVNSI